MVRPGSGSRFGPGSHGASDLRLPGRRPTTGPRGEPAELAAVAPLRRALYESLTVTSLPGLLRYGNRNSMAFSREARLPFLDHRLVEFAYTLPSHLLVSDGTTKRVLRRAMDGLIPDAVRDRMDRIGFATPERAWFLGPLRPVIERTLADLKRRDVIPAAAVNTQWRRLLGGRGESGNVWRLVNLELWCQLFLDVRSCVVGTPRLAGRMPAEAAPAAVMSPGG